MRRTPSVRGREATFRRTWAVLGLASLLICGAGCRAINRGTTSERILASRQYTLRGTDALHAGHWEEAEALFQAAIRSSPVDERARSGYAEALWERGACDLAIRQMEEAVRLSGGNEELIVRLGEMRLARGDQDGAASCADQALAEQRDLAAAWSLRGDIQRLRGKWDEALASYHRALASEPNNLKVHLATAEIYRQQGRPNRALATLNTLADHYGPSQTPVQVLYLQALAQRQMGRYDDAVTSLAAAASRPQAQADVVCQLAECQVLAGDSAAARLTALDGQRRFPQEPRIGQLVAQLESGQVRMAAVPAPATR